MKKITLLVAVLFATLSFGQNLLTNGDFETYADDQFEGFNKDSDITQVTDNRPGSAGTLCAKVVGGTQKLIQVVENVVAGNTYKVTVWYKVVSANQGDTTNARIWSFWLDNNGTKIYQGASSSVDVLRGPNNAYFDDNGNQWNSYSVDVVAPVGVTKFQFETRVYGGAIVNWDDFSLEDLGTMSNNKFNAVAFNLFPNPAKNLVNIAANGNVNVSVYNVMGQKVLATTNKTVNVAGLVSGVYLVEVAQNGAASTKKLVIE